MKIKHIRTVKERNPRLTRASQRFRGSGAGSPSTPQQESDAPQQEVRTLLVFRRY